MNVEFKRKVQDGERNREAQGASILEGRIMEGHQLKEARKVQLGEQQKSWDRRRSACCRSEAGDCFKDHETHRHHCVRMIKSG